MRFYPDIPSRRFRTLVRDLLVLVLLVGFALIGLWVHDVVDKLAVLGEGVRKVGDAVPFCSSVTLVLLPSGAGLDGLDQGIWSVNLGGRRDQYPALHGR